MKYLINFTLAVVLLVAHERSLYHPFAEAFTASRHGITFCRQVKSTNERVKCNHRYESQRGGDPTSAHKDSNMEKPDHSAYSKMSSNLMDTPPNRRRELFRQTQKLSSLFLATLLMGEKSVFAQEITGSELLKAAKTIVITGANSGIGFEACKRLVSNGHTIILACRSMNKAQDAMNRILLDDAVAMNGKLIPAECDLADLSSIQRFVSGLPPNTKIDTLCLNAGVARNTAATDCARTKDGFELTGKRTTPHILYWI